MASIDTTYTEIQSGQVYQLINHRVGDVFPYIGKAQRDKRMWFAYFENDPEPVVWFRTLPATRKHARRIARSRAGAEVAK